MTEQEITCIICGDPVSEDQIRRINDYILHSSCVHVKSEKNGIRGGLLYEIWNDGTAVVIDKDEKRHFIDISDLESEWLKE